MSQRNRIIYWLLGSALVGLGAPRPAGDVRAAQSDVDAANASRSFTPSWTILYKTVDGVSLNLYGFSPSGEQVGAARPAIVFFHGGAFVSGEPAQFYAQSAYLASRGIVAICSEYRIRNLHGTTPDCSFQDGKSAMRWVRSHAADLGVDPNRIAAAGGSAGGSIAAAVATLTSFDEPGEDLSVSCRPDALVIFNGLFDFGPEGYGFEKVYRLFGDRWTEFSPLHNIRAPFPPMLFLVGDKDSMVPVEAAQKIQSAVENAGGAVTLKIYADAGHGFFNYGRNGNFFSQTLTEVDRFLCSLGWLSGEPTVDP